MLLFKKKFKITNELAEELYKPVTRKFQRTRVNVNAIDEIWAADLIENCQKRRVNVNASDEIWAADLIDMQAFSKDNNGIKYLPTVIDVFSKFVWIVPLQLKTGQKLSNEFSRILEERRLSKM